MVNPVKVIIKMDGKVLTEITGATEVNFLSRASVVEIKEIPFTWYVPLIQGAEIIIKGLNI